MRYIDLKYIHAKPTKYTGRWYNGAGWYYIDAIGILAGPYSTITIADHYRKQELKEILNESRTTHISKHNAIEESI